MVLGLAIRRRFGYPASIPDLLGHGKMRMT